MIALTTHGAVQNLAHAAAAAEKAGSMRVSGKTVLAPCPDFVDSVRPAILGINVSHRPQHKLSGEMHEETLYGVRRNGGRPETRVRKWVHSLKRADDIVDPVVRAAVQRKVEELGGDFRKLEHDPAFMPGGRVPIRKARVRDGGTPQPIGQGERRRHIQTGNNHHVAIFSGPGKRGKREAWHAVVVSRLEAMARKKDGRAIIERSLPDHPEWEFQFSLMGGDMVEMDDPKGGRSLFVVRTISEDKEGNQEIDLVRHIDSRLIADMKKTGDWIRIRNVDELRARGCRKVLVSVLGEVKEIHD